MTRHIIVGDIHGCGQELLSLLAVLDYPQPGDRLICVGDLFDRGPLPQIVLNAFLEHAGRGAKEGYSFESVCGNHDDNLLMYCRFLFGKQPSMPYLSGTGEQTIELIEQAGMLEDLAMFLEDLEHVDTIQDDAGRWAVVHAGIDVKLGLRETPRETKLAIRDWPAILPWHELYDGSDGLIVHGHQHRDEPLVRRVDDLPVVINVDTSCCYGGSLTAYIVEEDRFISVPAARVYHRERP